MGEVLHFEEKPDKSKNLGYYFDNYHGDKLPEHTNDLVTPNRDAIKAFENPDRHVSPALHEDAPKQSSAERREVREAEKAAERHDEAASRDVRPAEQRQQKSRSGRESR